MSPPLSLVRALHSDQWYRPLDAARTAAAPADGGGPLEDANALRRVESADDFSPVGVELRACITRGVAKGVDAVLMTSLSGVPLLSVVESLNSEMDSSFSSMSPSSALV